MRRFVLVFFTLWLGIAAGAQEFNKIPVAWKWLDNKQIAFSYDGSFCNNDDFAYDSKTGKTIQGVKAPLKFSDFPVKPEGAVNLTWSPDSTMIAFTRNNDIYVTDVEGKMEKRLTFDGTDLILNGYASWVYYEEIFGRPTKFRAFWWSPDSKTIAFYRFDNTKVPMFPIYSPKGQDGSLNLTRYPKCGETNPSVKIGFATVETGELVWADFNSEEDQYFGTPFWGADSKGFFVSREPRLQNELDLYNVSPADGSKSLIYHEEYKTWLDWIEGMIFTEEGLYMARCFETGWQQIYFLSYDGKTFKRLTDGPNWRINLLKVADNKVFFTANRESTIRTGLYQVDDKGVITSLSDPAYNIERVSISPDAKHFAAAYSNFTTPTKIQVSEISRKGVKSVLVADLAGPEFDPSKYALAQNISLTTEDGFVLPAYIVYPLGFDPSKKYPVHMDLYGGPDAPQVRDRWMHPGESSQWWSENGIIEIMADCRAAGHHGRAGLDQIYRQLSKREVMDFVEWGKWLQSLPYVKADKIGVEGFSFGGTMTSLLVMDHSEQFHYGIAGGGVYDWSLYDTHYTERFMDTPQNNPEGYAENRVVNHAANYPVVYDESKAGEIEPVMLKLNHGTGDDNVHFQNSLQLIDALHKEGKKFEFMIYPDGGHGYGGYQGKHFRQANREFWLKYLKN